MTVGEQGNYYIGMGCCVVERESETEGMVTVY